MFIAPPRRPRCAIIQPRSSSAFCSASSNSARSSFDAARFQKQSLPTSEARKQSQCAQHVKQQMQQILAMHSRTIAPQ